ncbi:MAG TPA: type I glyceraldehyde-3-phosphate dehydrogenase [Polyangiaceae bacterium]|nr:type I glyceraldehyde-3-phosphate dehydrogenase [Polyangiaceae bacterium]
MARARYLSGMLKIGINGLGRIGRMALRAALRRQDAEVVAVNDLLEPEHLAYLLAHDSVHGRLGHRLRVDAGALYIDDRRLRVSAVKDPAEAAWRDAGVDVVIESTGVVLTQAQAEAHLRAGARRVIVSAPAKDDMPTFVHGVNSDRYGGQAVISAASCTTNCLAPLAKVVHQSFGIRRGLMTTIHATTATQKVVDGVSGKDWRFGRGILGNIIPASTGAAQAVAKVLPELAGKLTGMSFRVPVADVSVVDLTCELERPTTYAEICEALRNAAQGPLHGVLGYGDDELVSSDIRGEACTSVFDAKAGIQLDPTFVKLVAWYDNEWAYASKLLDLAIRVAA